MNHLLTAGSRENPIACTSTELELGSPWKVVLGLLPVVVFLALAFVDFGVYEKHSDPATTVSATLDDNGVLHYRAGGRERQMPLPPSWSDHVAAGGSLKLRVFDDPARLPERHVSGVSLKSFDLVQCVILLLIVAALYSHWRQQRSESRLRARLKSSGQRVRAERVHVVPAQRRRGKGGSRTVYRVLGHFQAPDGKWYVVTSDSYEADPSARLRRAIEVLCDAIEPRRSRFADWTLPPR